MASPQGRGAIALAESALRVVQAAIDAQSLGLDDGKRQAQGGGGGVMVAAEPPPEIASDARTTTPEQRRMMHQDLIIGRYIPSQAGLHGDVADDEFDDIPALENEFGEQKRKREEKAAPAVRRTAFTTHDDGEERLRTVALFASELTGACRQRDPFTYIYSEYAFTPAVTRAVYRGVKTAWEHFFQPDYSIAITGAIEYISTRTGADSLFRGWTFWDHAGDSRFRSLLCRMAAVVHQKRALAFTTHGRQASAASRKLALRELNAELDEIMRTYRRYENTGRPVYGQ